MKTKSIVISMLVILALCVAAISCRKDTPSTPIDPDNTENPNNTEIPDSPTDCIDPEDAITVNLRNDGGSVTILDWPLKISTANNFEYGNGSVCVTIVSVGEVSGLGCVTSIPQTGWSHQVAVIPGCGYVLRFAQRNEATDSYIAIKYARLYVVRYLLNATNEGILGAEIKYQQNWYELEPPIVSTGIVTEIASTKAMCGGYVISDGGCVDTERGICWSTSEEPTVNDNYALNGIGIGEYSIQMTNLAPNTRYYVRAYAKNDMGISYGVQRTFKTLSAGIGNDYSVLFLNELNGNDKFIEIYNMGYYDLSLEGMYLTKDGVEDDIKWIGDNTHVIPAFGYLVLYSIDMQADHPELAENMFFNSGLSAKKTIRFALHMPDGTLRDVFTRGSAGVWGQSASDVTPLSYARTPDGGDWKLADPTPGGANPSFGEPIPQE
ncbi:MAG: DUF5036 family protein [Bacteroidaceae bacterium]|nr:DUF5036 family protein [Bacteroidaceae bacterium]